MYPFPGILGATGTILLIALVNTPSLHACSRCTLSCSSGSISPHPDQVAYNGGWELRVLAGGSRFFSRTAYGLSFETAFRTAGIHADRQGRFSIGLQAGYYPSLGNAAGLKHDIAHLRAFNLNDHSSLQASVFIGRVRANEGELLLIPQDGADIHISGQLSWSSSGKDVIEYVVYRPTGFSMSMASIGIPLRWYFGTDAPERPRFHAELGLDLDIISTRGNYEVTTETITFDQVAIELAYSMTVRQETEPMGGTVSSNSMFTRVHVAAGVSYERFGFFLQCGRLLARTIEYEGEKYERMRGNILALPFLANTNSQDEVAVDIENDGAVVIGRTDIPKESSGSAAESSDRVNGISRFWNAQQWSFGISFRLR